MNAFDMTNRVAFVTGAAGGIGGAVARSLAESGADVAMVDNNAGQLQASVDALVGQGLRAVAYPADVTARPDVESVVEEVERHVGPIDFLVNAAGVLRVGGARSLSEEDWRVSMDVNATGVYLTSRAVVNKMITRSSGAIVTVASNAAATPRVDMAAYAASKAAATMFTKCLGLEVARYGIRCNLVAPGSTDTEMLRSLWAGGDGVRASIEGAPESYRVGIPLRRLALPADVADAVLFLLSERARHITMHDLTVDGGATLGV